MKTKSFNGMNILGVKREKINLSKGAFIECQAGLPIIQIVGKVLSLLILSSITGILAVLAAIFATGLIGAKSNLYSIFLGISIATLALIGLVIIFKRGFSSFLGLSLVSFVVSGVLILILRASSIIDSFIYISFTVTSEIAALWLGSIVAAASWTLSNTIVISTGLSAILGIGVALLLIGHLSSTVHPDLADIAIAISILLTSRLIGWNAIQSNTRFIGIARLAINLTAIGGTSFRQSNLTEADFTRATLKHTDFRGANLTRTCWRSAKGLEFARIDKTYLANPKIRQLVVGCDGQGQNFDGLDLTGVNLLDASLQDASFVGANLNQSNLRGADLSRAILKQTKLEGADLIGAILTGAYIEDWGITSTTKLENIKCEHVYMRVPTKENPNPLRKPDNWQETFAEGEFADFIQPYFDTLDLYHSQDVDPRAISIAFKRLYQNHLEANLEIVAMEKRGQNSFNLKVRTSPAANKSELSSEYFADYNQLKALSEVRLLLLAEKDARILSLEQMIKTALHQPTFNVETIQGDFMPENKGINISAGDNVNISGVNSGDGIVNWGPISGNVTNSINQLPEEPASDQPNLKELFAQLQQAIQADVDLSDPDKSDLLEQVQALIEAKQAEEPTKREGLTRKAKKMFDATLKSLPDTAKIVEACSKLLPMILKALGFPS